MLAILSRSSFGLSAPQSQRRSHISAHHFRAYRSQKFTTFARRARAQRALYVLSTASAVESSPIELATMLGLCQKVLQYTALGRQRTARRGSAHSSRVLKDGCCDENHRDVDCLPNGTMVPGSHLGPLSTGLPGSRNGHGGSPPNTAPQ